MCVHMAANKIGDDHNHCSTEVGTVAPATGVRDTRHEPAAGVVHGCSLGAMSDALIREPRSRRGRSHATGRPESRRNTSEAA